MRLLAALAFLLLAGCSEGGTPFEPTMATAEAAEPVRHAIPIDEPEGTPSPPPCAAGVCVTGYDDGVFAGVGLDEDTRLVAVQVTLTPAFGPVPGLFRVSLECLSRACSAPVLLSVEGELPLTLAGAADSPPGAALQMRFESLEPTAGIVGGYLQAAQASGEYTVETAALQPAP